MLRIMPGVALALVIAAAGQYLADFIGLDLMGLPQSPVSGIMVAILLGVLVGNAVTLPAAVQPGVRFSLVRILRLGIVLLGIRLSLAQAGAIGLKGLPVIVVTVASALVLVTWVARRLGLTARLGTLIAVGTGICGATAIVATAPTIGARDEEVSYSVAVITLFGVLAMLAYPFAAHWLFDGDAFRSGLFLGTAVHETAQVAGAGLVYQQYFGSPEALNVATVTKLVRNLGMLIVIPLMAVYYHRHSATGSAPPRWYTMVPLFVVGFALMSLARTIGDLPGADGRAFGLLEPGHWQALVAQLKTAAEYCLAVAMAAVGLGTSAVGVRRIGLKPLAVGLVSALVVGIAGGLLIWFLY
jgi:uncharacterized integral membrane protein (TIGR00698 family)